MMDNYFKVGMEFQVIQTEKGIQIKHNFIEPKPSSKIIDLD